MKFTLSWLKDYIDTDASVNDIADTLTMLGIEVEELSNPGEILEQFCVAEIKSVQKHPDADKLSLLEVFDGKETLQIVCGAPNCRVGLKGILARPGNIIPASGEALKGGVKIRGVESQGMMCSEKELNLSDNHEGIIDLPDTVVVGACATTAIASDVVFEIKVTPNRGDCLGVYGIARELAASGKGTLKPIDIKPLKNTFKSPIGIKIETENCKQFAGIYVKNVKNCDSPEWIKSRLTAVGLRPISALVDVTNYINIAFCRPLHVFDADTLNNNLIARQAENGEQILALDEKTYTLTDKMMVIADETKAMSIAGIMGAENSGCNENTKNVFIESAFFMPQNIASTGKALNVLSDSRYRFERGVDHKSTTDMAIVAANMIMELCGGEASEIVVAGEEFKPKSAISYNPEMSNQKCGVVVSLAETKDILEKLGCEVSEKSGELQIIPPSWRFDIENKYDIVEEVVRVKGYEHIPSLSMPRNENFTPTLLPHQIREVMVRRALASSRGLFQSISWSFMSSNDAKLFNSKGLKLANPITEELDEMRPSIVPNLLKAIKHNLSMGFSDFGLFEIGPVFYGANPNEQNISATTVRYGNFENKSWQGNARKVDAFDAKADAVTILATAGINPDNLPISTDVPSYYHPGKSGAFVLGKTVIGYFGELHPAILKHYDLNSTAVICEVFLDKVPLPKTKGVKTQKRLNISELQAIKRDFAFIADENVDAIKITNAVAKADKDIITDVKIFDIYRGDKLPENKKSVAIQITIQPQEKTLTDKEIEALSQKVIANVEKETGASLRA